MADTFTCPECGVRLRRSLELTPGARVQCPRCTIQFLVPEVVPDAPAPPAETFPDLRYREAPDPRAEEDGAEIDRAAVRRADDPPPRRRARAEDEDAYPRPPIDEDEDYPRSKRRVGHPDDLSSDYTIDSRRWFAFAWRHWGKIVGPAVGYQALLFVIYYSIVGVFGAMGMIAQFLLLAPLEAGLTLVCLAQLQGRRWVFGDFFGGFRHYAPILLPALIKSCVMMLWALPMSVGPFILLVFYDGPENVPVLMWLVPAGIAAVFSLPSIYVQIRLFFALPLILDRNFGAGDAITTSWRLTSGHFFALLGVHLIFYAMLFVGLAVCYVGVWFVVPYVTLAATAGYLLIAGTEPPVSPGTQDAEPFHEDEDA